MRAATGFEVPMHPALVSLLSRPLYGSNGVPSVDCPNSRASASLEISTGGFNSRQAGSKLGTHQPRSSGIVMSGDIIDSAQVRRGALFLVNIGVPVIVGTVKHQPDGALIGAVIGMLLAFADNDRELIGRLRLLALNAVMIAGCGIIGYLCRNSAPTFWSVFVAITLSVGMAARGGREMLLTARHGAIALRSLRIRQRSK